MHVHRFQERLGRPGEAQELIHQRIDPVDLVSDQVGEGFAEIGIVIPLRQELGKGLDRDQRVLDFVRHSGGERAETGEAVAATNLQLETFQGGDVGQHHERAELAPSCPWKMELLARTMTVPSSESSVSSLFSWRSPEESVSRRGSASGPGR